MKSWRIDSGCFMSRELLFRGASETASDATKRLFQRRLLAWYRRHGRALPWRGTRDPYRIWVSEVMLQQTQVATAIPFYQAFLDRFPDLASLARARESDVLAAWSGLGYYRRPRHLLAAARLLMRDGAVVPDDPDRFGRLPGVGRYTLGAVMSIAFDRAMPVVDGNVARVLSRLAARPLSVREPRDARRLWAMAESLVPMRSPGDWNQAVMELGARVCTPRAPDCRRCPVRASCRAYASGRPERFPPAAVRPATRRVRRAIAVLTRGGRLLLERQSGSLLNGLWEPPGVTLAAGADPRTSLARALSRLGVRARLEPTGIVLRQRITHRAVDAALWRATPRAPVPTSTALRFVAPDAARVALTAMARRVARAMRAGES
jgi:A/G-specific adenine glycosylase